MITANVYDNAGNAEATLEAGTITGVFRQAQYRYGHCLGRLYHRGYQIGWRFARCMGEEMCARIEVVNIILVDWAREAKGGQP